jgi:thiamine-phosphate pyrophosphorylase
LDGFESYLRSIFKNHRVDYACFRDKRDIDLIPYISSFLKVTKEYNIDKTLINSHLDLAIKYRFYGVHLTSNQFNTISRAKSNSLFTTVSTHSLNDIKIVKEECDAITFSPIFDTPNKPKPKGVEELKRAVKLIYPKKCFALGGVVTKKDILEVEKSGAYGFASIRHFVVN